MSLQISAESTSFEADPQVISTVISSLATEGYKPLLSEAKRQFFKALTGKDTPLISSEAADDVHKAPYRYAQLTGNANERSHVPLAGDVFVAEGSAALLYLLLYAQETTSGSDQTEPTRYLEAGCIGLDYVVTELQEFLLKLGIILKEAGVKASWGSVQNRNPRFVAVSQDRQLGFESGDNMTDEEVKASETLNDSRIREFADTLKRAGQIWAVDVAKENSIFVSRLEEAKLLTKEYVVICRQTLSQVNRVRRREGVQQMSQMGVLCSCGSPIDSEKVEELLIASPLLKRMLDRNFWTSAKLIEALRRFGVPPDRSSFSIHEGVEEVDVLVDLDGKLLLIDLQEDEFLTRDVYRFAARMGGYKPDYAFIVATRGIAPGAKEQFNKMGTEGKIMFVTTFAELLSELARVVDEIRTNRAKEILGQFEVFAEIGVPLGNLFLDRIQVQAAGKSKLGPQPVTMHAAARVLP